MEQKKGTLGKLDLKRPEITAVVAAMMCGLITHLFGLVTILHNNDDIGQLPYGYGTGITSGRWLLSILGDFAEKTGGNYNLHYLNGILFLAIIAVGAGFVVSALQIENRKSAALVGMLFSVFPTVASTMYFRYTTVYYGISFLLAILAVWVLNRFQYGLLFSVVCTALSMGIYQAYVPLTIGMFVLLLIRETLVNETKFWILVKKGLYDCAALLLGLVLYYICLKVCLALFGTELSDYNGVNNMGKISIERIPGLIKEALYSFCMLPFKNYCGLANLKWIGFAYLVLGAVTFLIIVYLALTRIRKIHTILLVGLLCVLFPIAVNFIVIMCPDGYIYTIMLYPFVLVGCVPLVLLECVPINAERKEPGKLFLRKTAVLAVMTIILGYAYDTNIDYASMYYANRQAENYLNAMIVQVRMTEEFTTDLEWAFIGNIDDPLFRNPWQYEIQFGGNEPASMLVNRDTRYAWIQNYFGYMISYADEEKIGELSQLDEVKQMPCWPNEGSIKVVGDTVVIKCQELQ